MLKLACNSQNHRGNPWNRPPVTPSWAESSGSPDSMMEVSGDGPGLNKQPEVHLRDLRGRLVTCIYIYTYAYVYVCISCIYIYIHTYAVIDFIIHNPSIWGFDNFDLGWNLDIRLLKTTWTSGNVNHGENPSVGPRWTRWAPAISADINLHVLNPVASQKCDTMWYIYIYIYIYMFVYLYI